MLVTSSETRIRFAFAHAQSLLFMDKPQQAYRLCSNRQLNEKVYW